MSYTVAVFIKHSLLYLQIVVRHPFTIPRRMHMSSRHLIQLVIRPRHVCLNYFCCKLDSLQLCLNCARYRFVTRDRLRRNYSELEYYMNLIWNSVLFWLFYAIIMGKCIIGDMWTTVYVFSHSYCCGNRRISTYYFFDEKLFVLLLVDRILLVPSSVLFLWVW